MAIHIETMPFGPQVGKREAIHITGDQPCPFAKLVVSQFGARLNIKTNKPVLWVYMPYQGYILDYTITPDLYPCVGWTRRDEDFTITITDGKTWCDFVVPGLNKEV